MRARVAVSVVAAVAVVVAGAVVVTAVRSEARERSSATAVSAVPLARASGTSGTTSSALITVPGLVDTAGAAASRAAQSQAAQSQAAESQAVQRSLAAASSSAAASWSADAQSKAAASSSAASVAAADAAALEAAANQAAAARAAAVKAAADAAATKAAKARAAAEAAASKAALAKAAASRAAAAAQSASAAANPAPDTSAAVEQAVGRAQGNGITQSVVVMNRQTGSVTTAVNSTMEMPSMSLVKLMLAADVIDQAGGVANVPSDALDQLHHMIAVSDDSIAQGLYDDNGQGDIITRVATRYGLTQTSPSPQPRYWGDVQITAHDMASFLYQLLSSPDTSLWFTDAMQDAQSLGADGFDQNFGVNAVAGTGSKQGWGCCLESVLTIHSMGFTANQIIVVMSTAPNDKPYTELSTAKELMDDAGAQASLAAVTRTVNAALPVT